ncbi:MAG TPA: DUF5715 family protein [Longimicrobiaceae bacterium]|nr:DUF5715 family protein [Longimicrobiaceae bacterium]
MIRRTATLVVLLVLAAAPLWADVPVMLRGSPESMVRQNRVANEYNLDFFRTPAEVAAALDEGVLEWVLGDENYELAYRSFPVARPELRLFIERLAAQYRAGCGEKLYVTSLTRPSSLQPPNAHRLSVHPAGMAVDLRISQNVRCQQWIEGTLLSMERQGILDITREQTPPHYHLALFPDAYLTYLEERLLEDPLLAEFLAPADAEMTAQGEFTVPAADAFVPPQRQDVAQRESRTGWIERLVTLPVRLLSLFRRG